MKISSVHKPRQTQEGFICPLKKGWCTKSTKMLDCTDCPCRSPGIRLSMSYTPKFGGQK
jgi:hypothetical protein